MTSSTNQWIRRICMRARMDGKAFAFSCLTAFVAFCLFSTAAWAQSWTLTVQWAGSGAGTVDVSAVALVEASPLFPVPPPEATATLTPAPVKTGTLFS
jgi:hypothetical protein